MHRERSGLGTSRVVIDASFYLKLFLPEKASDKAHALMVSWVEKSVEVAAPTLIMFEAASVMRNKVQRNILDEEETAEIIEHMKRMDMTLLYTDDVFETAWEIGARLKSATLYDCFYLAVSELLDAPLWTADARLHQSAKHVCPNIQLL
jgi:predicted nucleic acid-binding protein